MAVPLGNLADKIGEKLVIAGGFLIAALSYMGMAMTTHIVTLVLLFVVLGIYSAATDGMQRVLAAKSLDGELAATGQGFLNMALGFSSLGAGIIGGLLWTTASSQMALFYAAFASMVGLILFSVVAKVHLIE